MNSLVQQPERGNRSENGLTAEQTLEVWVMIGGKVEKSENRVVAAIADLKADMNGMKADISTLNRDLNDVRIDVAGIKNRMLYYALLILVVLLLAPDGLQGILELFLTKS